jgi:hypothetical protein
MLIYSICWSWLYQHYLCIYSFLYIESHGTLNTTGTTFPLGYKKRMDPKQPQWTSFLSKKTTVSQSTVTNLINTMHNINTCYPNQYKVKHGNQAKSQIGVSKEKGVSKIQLGVNRESPNRRQCQDSFTPIPNAIMHKPVTC